MLEKWDSASPEVRDDVNTVSARTFGLAAKMLKKVGSFTPFAMVMKTDGEVELFDLVPSAEDEFSTMEYLADLTEAVRARRDEYRAISLCTDLRLHDSGDFVKAVIEHAEGTTLVVDLPYKKKRRKGYKFGDLEGRDGGPTFWGDSEETPPQETPPDP